MRPLFAFIAILVIGGLIAVGAYDAGLSQAVVQTSPATGTVPVAYYGHPYGWGFGFFPFGFLFPLFGLFLFFGLMRASFWGWGGRGYYGHRSYGYRSYAPSYTPRSYGGSYGYRSYGSRSYGSRPYDSRSYRGGRTDDERSWHHSR